MKVLATILTAISIRASHPVYSHSPPAKMVLRRTPPPPQCEKAGIAKDEHKAPLETGEQCCEQDVRRCLWLTNRAEETKNLATSQQDAEAQQQASRQPREG